MFPDSMAGPPAPYGAQEGPPPELAALLAGGAPPPMAGPPPMGPEAGPDVTPDDLLRDMLDLAGSYREVETDDKDRLLMEKVTTLIQQILADRQADHDQMLGGNARILRRLAG